MFSIVICICFQFCPTSPAYLTCDLEVAGSIPGCGQTFFMAIFRISLLIQVREVVSGFEPSQAKYTWVVPWPLTSLKIGTPAGPRPIEHHELRTFADFISDQSKCL